MVDVVVVGLGCVGLSTTYHMASKGLKVIGLEQFGDSGAEGTCSYGEARIWRHLQPSEEATQLMVETQKLWKKMEEKSGEKLIIPTGILVVGPKDSPEFKEFKDTAAADVEFLSSK